MKSFPFTSPRYLFIISILFSLFVLPGCKLIREKEKIQLTVPIYDIPVTHIYDEKGLPINLGREIIREIAKREKWELNEIVVPYTTRDKMLETGEIDIIPLSSIENEFVGLFSDIPVLKVWSSVYTLKSNQIENNDDLHGKRIGLYKSMVSNKSFFEYTEKYNLRTDNLFYTNLAELVSALATGKVDAIVMEKIFPFSDFYSDDFEATSITFGSRFLGFNLSNKVPIEVKETIDSYIRKWLDNKESVYYELLSKHYDKETESLVSLELPTDINLWLEEQPIVDVYFTPCPPFAYFEEGNLRGAVISYFKKLAQSIDLEYKLHIVDSPIMYDTLVQDSNAMILYVSDLRNYDHIVQSDSFLKLDYVLALSSDNYYTIGFSGLKTNKILLGQGALKLRELQADYPNIEIHTSANFEEVFHLVREGEYEAGYLPKIISDYYSRTLGTKGIKFVSSKEDYGCNLCFGVSRENTKLLTLMNLLISQAPPNLFQNTLYMDRNDIRFRPLSLTEKIVVIAVVLFLLLLIVCYFLVRQSRVKQAIYISNQQLSRTEKLAKIGEVRLNVSKQKVELKKTFCQSLGYNDDPILGFNQLVKLCPDKYKSKQTQSIKQFLEGAILKEQYCFKNANNTEVWLSVQMGIEMFTFQGDKVRYGAIQDITMEKQQEAKRLRSEYRFRSIYKNSPIGILYKENEYDSIRLNNSAQELFTFKSETGLELVDLMDDLLVEDSDCIAISKQQNVSFTAIVNQKNNVIASHIKQLGVSVCFSANTNNTPFLVVMLVDQTTKYYSERKIIHQRDMMYKVANEIGISFWTANIADLKEKGIFGFYQHYIFEQRSKIATDIFLNCTPQDRAIAQRNIEQLLDGSVSKGQNELILNKDGLVRIVFYSWNVVHYSPENGKIIVHGLEHDVTKMRLSERGFELAQQSANLGNWVINLRSKTINMSDGFLRILDLDNQRSDEENFEIVLSRIVDLKKIVFLFYRDLLSDSKKIDFEFIYSTSSKEEKVIQCYGSLFDQDSSDLLLFGIVQDVTAKANAVRNLINAKNQLSIILESVSSIVLFISSDFNLVWSNKKANQSSDFSYRVSGYRYQVAYSFSESCEKYAVMEAMQTGKVVKKVITFPSGRIYSGTFAPSYSSSGELQGCVETFDEITEVKKKEMELFHAKEKAEESDRLKSSFLANLSHEIRSPLSNITGFSNLLTKPKYSENQKKEFVSLIEYNQNHLLELIDDVLELSKIEADVVNLEVERVDIDSICLSLVKSLSVGLSNSVELAYIPFVNHLYIHTDRVKLIQVLTNLISNAKKFTKSGGIWLYVDELKDSGEIEFKVSDTGCGIDASSQKVIFNRFEKGISKEKGTGLGLSICNAIASKLGGSLRVESELNNGATFIFTLPLILDNSSLIGAVVDCTQEN